MANPNCIHLVSKVTPQSQPLDPAEIAAAVLETVRECSSALEGLREYSETRMTQVAAQLNALELVALRAMSQKVGRS